MRRQLASAAVVLAALALALALAMGLVGLDRLAPLPLARLERPPATVVEARDGHALRLFLSADETWRLPVTLDEVAPELVRAVIAAEDRWFRWHPGVNPLAVVRAGWSNLRAGRVVSGASTIPMQLARLAEPRPRTLGAKLVEAFRALQLVAHLPRERILELYLNRAPFGGNLEGVGAAALFYFDKHPDALSTGEIALLVALPRAPTAYDPVRYPERARAARDRVLEQLHARGLLSAERLRDARQQPLPRRRRPVPFEAPHLARWAKRQAPDEPRIATTLDRRVQRITHALVAAASQTLRSQGIANASAVVIENDGRALRALVGSADFFDAARDGQVDGARARRSPGSTLKPFLYGLTFDRGSLVPASFVLDVPTDFSGYVAENYDGRYRGRVTVHDALVHSLNAPAVRVLADVGLRRFHALLRAGGLTSLDRPARSYGLPLVLGAGEVTLVELTNLYATLADGGLHRPLRWAQDQASTPTRLLSAEAASLLTDVLTQLERPDLPRSWALTRDIPAVAWKTGTSYGHRDAWAIGFSRRYTIGIWVGNFDGRGRPGISGAEHAAPLLFDLFGALDRGGREPAPRQAPRTREIEVCALSHELVGPFCSGTVRVPIISGTSTLRPCTQHRRVFVDPKTGLRLTGSCLGARRHTARVVEHFPAALVSFWRSQGRAVAGLPPLHPACRGVPGGNGPQIVSPDPRTPYRLRGDAPRAYQRVELRARASPGTARLYWYRDGLLHDSAPPGDPLFLELAQGRHRLVVVDDAGRSDSVEYRVE